MHDWSCGRRNIVFFFALDYLKIGLNSFLLQHTADVGRLLHVRHVLNQQLILLPCTGWSIVCVHEQWYHNKSNFPCVQCVIELQAFTSSIRLRIHNFIHAIILIAKRIPPKMFSVYCFKLLYASLITSVRRILPFELTKWWEEPVLFRITIWLQDFFHHQVHLLLTEHNTYQSVRNRENHI